jgi:hypothetical protein
VVEDTNRSNDDVCGEEACSHDFSVRFGVWRGRWLDQVHEDPALTGEACRVMYNLSRFLNKKTRDARPGDIVLAERSHVSVRTVQRAIESAVRAGHLCVTAANGRNARILRPLILDGRQPQQQEGGHNVRQEGRHKVRQEGRQPFRSSPAGTKTWALDSRNSQNSHNSHNFRNSRNPLQTPSGSASVALRPRTPTHFEEAEARAQAEALEEVEQHILNVVGQYGRMSVGGIVEYGRNCQCEGFDGVQVGRMINKGLLVRDGDYVYLADALEADRGKEETERVPTVEGGQHPLVLTGDDEPAEKTTERKRAVPWPKDFALDADMRAFGKANGFTHPEMDELFGNFRDFHVFDGNVCQDWRLAWQTWVLRKAVQYGKRPPATAALPKSRISQV